MQRIIRTTLCFAMLAFCFSACDRQSKKKEPATPTAEKRKVFKVSGYLFTKPAKWSATADFKDSKKRSIAFAVNRTDSAFFRTMDSVLIPMDLSGEVQDYLPFPPEVPFLKEVTKLIFFSYPTQTFGAYENGELVYAGPTSMGRKKDPTPTGLFFTNWKAEESTSSFDDEWNLRWNFNVENKLGVGWHQYAMPGYPASHSCLRLQETDAKYLYTWAEQWKLGEKDSVELKGTPVIVFGAYPFGTPRPWLKLAADPASLNITAQEIEKITSAYYKDIIYWQQKRNAAIGN